LYPVIYENYFINHLELVQSAGVTVTLNKMFVG